MKQLIKKVLRIKSPSGDQLKQIKGHKPNFTAIDEVDPFTLEQLVAMFKEEEQCEICEETEKAHKHFFQMVDRFVFLLHDYMVFKCDCGEFAFISEDRFYGRIPRQTWPSNSALTSRKS